MKKITLLFLLGLLVPCLLSSQTVTTIASQIPIDDDLIITPDGNLIGSHYMGTALRRLSLEGSSEIFATGFNTPNGLAYDSQGALFMADNEGDAVYKFASDGTYELFTPMEGVSGLMREWDSDTLIATSYTQHKLSKIAPDGSRSDFISDPRFNGPVGLCYDETHNLYVANFNNRRIFRISPDGVVSDFATPSSSGNLGFIAYSKGFIYATLFNRNQIWRIDSTGLTEQWLGSTAGSIDGDASVARFNGPNGIRATPSGDTLFISDFQTRSVRMITDFNTVSPSKEVAQFNISLDISPNPAQEVATIRINLAEANQLSLWLLDSQGRLVRTALTRQKISAGEHAFQLPLSGLPPGLYHCRLEGLQNTMVSKAIMIGR